MEETEVKEEQDAAEVDDGLAMIRQTMRVFGADMDQPNAEERPAEFRGAAHAEEHPDEFRGAAHRTRVQNQRAAEQGDFGRLIRVQFGMT